MDPESIKMVLILSSYLYHKVSFVFNFTIHCTKFGLVFGYTLVSNAIKIRSRFPHIFLRTYFSPVLLFTNPIFLRSYLAPILHFSDPTLLRSYFSPVRLCSNPAFLRSYFSPILLFSDPTFL